MQPLISLALMGYILGGMFTMLSLFVGVGYVRELMRTNRRRRSADWYMGRMKFSKWGEPL